MATGFRQWVRQDGVWVAGAFTAFSGGAHDAPPMVAATRFGVVYGSINGELQVLTQRSRAVPSAVGILFDVAVTPVSAVAIAVEQNRKVNAIDLGDGSVSTLYDEADMDIAGVSYGGGALLVVSGAGAEATLTLVSADGLPIPLDLLADGEAQSAVLTPDGASLVFATQLESVVYTLALGSQGPAASFDIPLAGAITNLDSDGSWIAGLAGDRSFLFELATGSFFAGPVGVRFSFNRDERLYIEPGLAGTVDGRFFGYVTAATDRSIRFDEAGLLTGDDAAAAAEAAGQESPPPNDFFIQNTSEQLATIPLGQGVIVHLQANIPEAGVGLESVTLEQWLSLRDGEPTGVNFEWYGAGALPYWITIAGGEVTLLEEVFLP